MKKHFILIISLCCIFQLSAQQRISGTVFDDKTEETLIGANIILDNGQGTVTDLNGYYELLLSEGNYKVTDILCGLRELHQKY